jgi:hypothetical protein
MSRDQQLVPPRKISGRVAREQVFNGLRLIERTPMSSRVSQIAAALLFHLRTVDIR